MLKTRPFAAGTVVPVSFLLYLVSFTVKSDKIDKEGNIDQGRRNSMLLFSTVLSFDKSKTPDDLIRLVLEWNETSIRAVNRVPDVRWNGEHDVRYGDDRLSLEFMEDPERHVLAVRHEKVTDEAIAWDSDFVADFSKGQISVRLDRTFSEEALSMNAAFSTPHFITLLIEHGWLSSDGDLAVERTPRYVDDADLALCGSALSEQRAYRLPIVFVTKTAEDSVPLDVDLLASRLKGAAHVLVEGEGASCQELRRFYGWTEERYGAVRIFYPAETVKRKKFTYRSATGNGDQRLERVVCSVIQYGLVQRIDNGLTWNGINNALLNDRLEHQTRVRLSAESARQKAEDEVSKVYEVFDDDLRILQEKVAELTRVNEALQYENQGLRAKLAGSDAKPLLFCGEEEDFYQGEVRDLVLAELTQIQANMEEGTRRSDVLTDILEANPYYHIAEDRRQRIKELLKGYKQLTGAMQQELTSMGFQITGEGKHYKLTYQGDPRYTAILGKTPSDNRSGSNTAAKINRIML